MLGVPYAQTRHVIVAYSIYGNGCRVEVFETEPDAMRCADGWVNSYATDLSEVIRRRGDYWYSFNGTHWLWYFRVPATRIPTEHDNTRIYSFDYMRGIAPRN